MNISGILGIKLSLTMFASVDKTVGEMYTFHMVENIDSLTVLLSTHGAFIHRLTKIICTFLYVLVQNSAVFTCKTYSR